MGLAPAPPPPPLRHPRPLLKQRVQLAMGTIIEIGLVERAAFHPCN
jgi:hypothetical protein